MNPLKSFLPLALFLTCSVHAAVAERDVAFLRARPVWPKGRAERMNDFVSFRGTFVPPAGERCFLRLTGSTCYRVRLNGEFVAFGPARGPKGLFRVDEIPFDSLRKDGSNAVDVEVQGANVNSFEYCDQPSFLQAEVVCGTNVLLATGSGLEAFDTHEHVRKVPRFDYQRLFSEAYRIGASDSPERLELEIRPDVELLPRRVPFPAYAVDRSFRVEKTLNRRYDPRRPITVGREISLVGSNGYKGYRPGEFEVDVKSEIQRYVNDPKGNIRSVLWKGDKVSAGFVGLRVTCRKPGRLVAFLSELERPDFAGTENNGGYAVFWDICRAGTYDFESIVPNGLMFAETFFATGDGSVESVWVREYKSPLPFARKFAGTDRDLKTIYDAAAETLAQNAVDIFTDCPDRERAAWIGDTFFTGRAARHLMQTTLAEDVFLENYARAKGFDGIPEGALPMVYPGDHPNGEFIPNFCMWLGLQVAEYARRGGDPAVVEALKPKLMGFVRYMDRFRNEDGLLANLPGWVFLGWSDAGKYVKGVNYPSNMLYAGFLDALAGLCGDASLATRADELRQRIRRASWNGTWFRDCAESDACTECCQYYAFFFGIADFVRDGELWKRLVTTCGPGRDAKRVHPELAPSNSIFGYYMRFDMLLRTGLRDELARETKDYFLPMARKTGTIWENKDATGSQSHGLSSIAAYYADPPDESAIRTDVRDLAAELSGLSTKEFRARQMKAARTLCDFELLPPEIDMHPDPDKFAFDKLDFAMNGGMALTKGGRLWSVWVAGGDSERGFTVGTWSDDGGKSWKDPGFRIGSPNPVSGVGLRGNLHVARIIPNLWAAPDGSLRLYVYQAVGQFDQRGVCFECVCRDPDAAEPRWEKPKLIAFGSVHNKPFVGRDGVWYLPNDFENQKMTVDLFPELYEEKGCRILASTDQGRTWRLRGKVRPADTGHFAEHAVVERKDGSFLMFLRTGKGLMSSVSRDAGATWSVPTAPSGIRQAIARFSCIRLKSGRLLFVKNGRTPTGLARTKTGDRAELTAFLSDDDGKTWSGGLVLDERECVAYPDAFESDDGRIYVSYDHGRCTKNDEILFARFTEDEVLGGRITAPTSFLKRTVFAERAVPGR